MPLTHIDLGDGEMLTLEDARARVALRDPREKYTPELLEAILETRQERDYVSTTSLTAKCLRQQSIQRQEPYGEEVAAMWAAFRGTMFHGRLEQYPGEDAFEEVRFHVTLTIDGVEFPLSGSPDVVTRSGLLYDYKFTKEVPRYDYPWKDHIAQCNINRWLVDHAEKADWRGWRFFAEATGQLPEPIEGKEQGDIGDIKWVEDFRPMDWQGLILVYMDDKGTKPLLCTKSVDVPKADGKGTKKARVADVWSDEDAEAHILERYPEALDALTNLNIPPAPVGWEHQSHVLCGYCPVRKECAAREKEGR